MEDPPQRVLIIDTAWLGDVVFTTSLLGAVTRAWPAAEVQVLTAPRGEPILRGHPLVDKLWVFEKRGGSRMAGMLRLARRMRRERFDVILCAHPSFRSRLLTRLIGAPTRVGYYGVGSSLAFTHHVYDNLAVQPDHVMRRMALLQELVPEAQASPLHVALLPEAIEWANRVLEKQGLTETPLLGLVPGSAWATKQWPMKRFGELSERWMSSGGKSLIFVGPRDQSQAEQLASTNVNLIPVISEPLPHVAAMLARCNAVVGNDTGISFLAMAAGARQVVVLYGCTQVNFHFPLPHRAILAGVPCCLPRTGHGKHNCRWTRGEPWCMQQISVDRVWSEIRKALPGNTDEQDAPDGAHCR